MFQLRQSCDFPLIVTMLEPSALDMTGDPSSKVDELQLLNICPLLAQMTHTAEEGSLTARR